MTRWQDQDLAQLQAAHLQHLLSRTRALLVQQGWTRLIIYSGHAHSHFADDQTAPHPGYGHFLHWTGLTALTDSWLEITLHQTPHLFCYAPEDYWHATPELPQGTLADIMQITPIKVRGWPFKNIADLDSTAVIGDTQSLTLPVDSHQCNPSLLVSALNALRIHKTAYEARCLLEASRRAAVGHRAARDAFYEGGSEFDIHLAWQKGTRQSESDAPYHSIIGLNEHAGVLHYQHYQTQTPRTLNSLLIDAGVRYRGYCSDITRTWASLDQPRFAALINGLDRLQQKLTQEVKPGTHFVELHHKAHQGIALLLQASGIVKGQITAEALVETGITRAFFPHGLGHFLGVQVHDVGGLETANGQSMPPPEQHPALRLTHPLEAGMLLTIEPGLYFIDSLLAGLRSGPMSRHLDWPLIDTLSHCGGIRIEDNLWVTADGAENLTRAPGHGLGHPEA